jgi:hypothetical protein
MVTEAKSVGNMRRVEMKRISLVVITSLVGKGVEGDPIREIHTIFTEAGERLGQVDSEAEGHPNDDLLHEIAHQQEARF